MSPTGLSPEYDGADYFIRPFDTQLDAKEQDETPNPFIDAWRLTPSRMDPNSYMFANQPSSYCMPTPGGFGALYPFQVGDLHIPGMGMNAPLSLHLAHKLHAHDSIMQFQWFNPHFLHQPRTFQDALYHHQPQQLILQPQPEAFAPQPRMNI